MKFPAIVRAATVALALVAAFSSPGCDATETNAAAIYDYSQHAPDPATKTPIKDDPPTKDSPTKGSPAAATKETPATSTPTATPTPTPTATPATVSPSVSHVPAARCSVQGDPHVSTLDARLFDMMEQGVFRMFESRSFQIQIFTENCIPTFPGKSITCARGVAVAYGSSVARLFVADQRIVVARGTASAADWFAIERIGGITDAYRVFLNADRAAFVDVSLVPFGPNPYLNVVLQASGGMRASDAEGGVSGICGNWNGNLFDDSNAIVDADAISTSSNLFTCLDDACAKLTKEVTSPPAKSLSTDASTTALHQGYTALDVGTLALRAFDTTRVAAFAAARDRRSLRRAAQANPAKQVSLDQAAALCQRVLVDDIAVCAKYLPETTQRQYVDKVCAADAVLLGDLAFAVDAAKLSYLRECRRELDTRLTATPTLAAVQTDRASLYFGDLSKCASSCSGRGECLASGCKCAHGFTGLACDIVVE